MVVNPLCTVTLFITGSLLAIIHVTSISDSKPWHVCVLCDLGDGWSVKMADCYFRGWVPVNEIIYAGVCRVIGASLSEAHTVRRWHSLATDFFAAFCIDLNLCVIKPDICFFFPLSLWQILLLVLWWYCCDTIATGSSISDTGSASSAIVLSVEEKHHLWKWYHFTVIMFTADLFSYSITQPSDHSR